MVALPEVLEVRMVALMADQMADLMADLKAVLLGELEAQTAAQTAVQTVALPEGLKAQRVARRGHLRFLFLDWMEELGAQRVDPKVALPEVLEVWMVVLKADLKANLLGELEVQTGDPKAALPEELEGQTVV